MFYWDQPFSDGWCIYNMFLKKQLFLVGLAWMTKQYFQPFQMKMVGKCFTGTLQFDQPKIVDP